MKLDPRKPINSRIAAGCSGFSFLTFKTMKFKLYWNCKEYEFETEQERENFKAFWQI